MGKTFEEIKSLVSSTSGPQLSLSFNGKPASQTEVFPKADAPKQPTMKLTNAPSKGPFFALALDPDAPYPSFPIAGPILHLIQLDLVPTDDGTLETSTPPLDDWVQPAPPPLSGPHKYYVAIFEQPEGFSSKLGEYRYSGLTQRVRFDVDGFVTKTQPGKLVAAQMFKSG